MGDTDTYLMYRNAAHHIPASCYSVLAPFTWGVRKGCLPYFLKVFLYVRWATASPKMAPVWPCIQAGKAA